MLAMMLLTNLKEKVYGLFAGQMLSDDAYGCRLSELVPPWIPANRPCLPATLPAAGRLFLFTGSTQKKSMLGPEHALNR